MKALGAAALLLLAAMAAVPTAQAQGNPQGVTLVCPDLAAPIPYSGSAGLACTVTVGCFEFQNTFPEAHAIVSVVSPPAWLTSTPADVDFAPQDCLTGGGSVTGPVTVPLAVAPDAPAVVEHTLNLVADVGGAQGADTAMVIVEYRANYTLVPDVTFPLAVTGPEASFNVTVTQASNARSMIMMEQLKVTAGTLTGPISKVYENSAGSPVSETFKFTYKAPEGEWTNATATFTAFSHYLLLDPPAAGDYDAGTPMTFSFTNAAEPEDDEEEGNGIPAPVAPLLLLGLVALAVLVRRRA